MVCSQKMARPEKKFKPNYVLTTNVCRIVNSVTVVKSNAEYLDLAGERFGKLLFQQLES